VERWGPEAPEDSLAKRLALDLQGTLPVITGSGLTAPLARRWKTQLNENPELPAFWSDLPEADHNEICGWQRGAGMAPFAAVFLTDSDLHPRLRERIRLTCREDRAGGREDDRHRVRGRDAPGARAVVAPARRPRECLPGGA